MDGSDGSVRSSGILERLWAVDALIALAPIRCFNLLLATVSATTLTSTFSYPAPTKSRVRLQENSDRIVSMDTETKIKIAKEKKDAADQAFKTGDVKEGTTCAAIG